jgi:predicted transcriptional regulator
VVGVLAYPDIVGLLYQYCRDCDFSHARQKKKSGAAIRRFTVGDIMTRDVQAVAVEASLFQVMEALSAYRFGAILVRDREATPCGVISKTDLALAYKREIDSGVSAGSIMSSPVQTCSADDLLEDAIRKMIFSDVHRLFVQQSHPENIVGVFSLSDAARIRSGSCQACMSSRIQLDT